jgi:hypothetical protein
MVGLKYDGCFFNRLPFGIGWLIIFIAVGGWHGRIFLSLDFLFVKRCFGPATLKKKISKEKSITCAGELVLLKIKICSELTRVHEF